MAASELRSDLYRAVLALFDDVDLLVLPTAQVMPSTPTLDWPRRSPGWRCRRTTAGWRSARSATLLGAPALAMPAGFPTPACPWDCR